MNYKIHPAVGVARVGDSEDYYLGPETAKGLPQERTGGDVTRFRDVHGGIRRQAARFQIHTFDPDHPNAPGKRVQPGADGVLDIEWTVHVANKKAAWFEFQQQQGADGVYNLVDTADAKAHPLRNPRTTDAAGRKALIIDPGPRTVACRGNKKLPLRAEFSKDDPQAQGYPCTFPAASNLLPENNDITTLGSVIADDQGYLYTVGGHGFSGTTGVWNLSNGLIDNLLEDDTTLTDAQGTRLGQLRPVADQCYPTQEALRAAMVAELATHGSNSPADIQETADYMQAKAYMQPRLDTYANNNFWWDDTSDGPVTATVILEGGTRVEVAFPAWMMVAPPAYAPQLLNMVTLYDTLRDTFVTQGNLEPDVCKGGTFNDSYRPNFQADILPILQRPSDYRWVARINDQGIDAHAGLPRPEASTHNFMKYVRDPKQFNDYPLRMPQMAGDNPLTPDVPRNFLTLTRTQYFFLTQFSNGLFDNTPSTAMPTPGQLLDRGVLENCVGGPFCPGIEMTWIARDPNFFMEPFRFKRRTPGASGLRWDTNPHDGQGLEPGDATKYMALPWQADFNECSNQVVQNTSLWWWPSQRPYEVNYQDRDGEWQQGYWTRPSDINFDKDEEMVFKWKGLGFILARKDAQPADQGSSTPDDPAPLYIEVERRLPDGGMS
ncbi:LodA/GoxA family CTQ-dependent oxidase [Corallococcus sp. bb12-1]|uniref:LodA/GoxA family CTQ-dependent oxidase n=1 Tax=Corallococcus sp. bb12-1 TaxID=2996784 RepID=UPI00226F20D6|nr:LodA/GoxA family CTQ-dependent oxidase [Corallococcus sp. bb12-1]MCY1045302.1 LodA/GoxA family CTQ-dependent oxidase [Corallococcus sp. bb12-1]